MLLYHGTSEKNLRNILKNGLLPRKENKISNWEHTIDSNLDAIYLTNSYALYYAYCAVDAARNERLAILEIDTDKLNTSLLCSDEDAIAQIFKNSPQKEKLQQNWSLIEATEYFRNKMQEYSADVSLEVLGTCAYIGNIPISAISRVAFVKQKTYFEMVVAGYDPTISIFNYKFLGSTYRETSKWLFDPQSIEVKTVEIMPGIKQKSHPLPKSRNGIKVLKIKK